MFCVHPAGGISWPYIGLTRYLGPDYPLYGLQARGLAEPEELPATLEEMVADYLRQIRTVQPAGPYHLLGWSFGGVVAHALATELQRDGERVALLALLDAYPLGEESLQEAALSEQDVLTLLLDAAGLGEEEPLDEELDRDRVMDLLRRKGTIPAELLEERALAAVIDVSSNNVRLLRGFTPGRFDGDLLLCSPRLSPAPTARLTPARHHRHGSRMSTARSPSTLSPARTIT
nr:alpha/beta fold hydrolase [Protofrankia coriariae]